MRIAFGIDVSKNKSDMVGKNNDGEIIYGPITFSHNQSTITAVIEDISLISGEKLILMENTSMYWRQPAKMFYEAGFRVAVINAILIHSFGTNTIRNIKTDKADSYKIADYALTYWDKIGDYSPENEIREMLKMESRLYNKTNSLLGAVKNNLIAICDQTYPDVNNLFWNGIADKRNHIKWVDYVLEFWHRDCVVNMSKNEFIEAYRNWCKKSDYRFRIDIAERTYDRSVETIATFPYSESTKKLVQQTAETLNSLYDNLAAIKNEMGLLASELPEYEAVMSLPGCGPVTGPQIMAEIGDIRRFRNKKALIAYAGLDSPPYQSGMFVSKSRHISKKGSSHLRKTVFMIIQVILMHGDEEDSVYQFLCRKRNEGKHYFVYMTAACSKFLRVYYGKVSEALTLK